MLELADRLLPALAVGPVAVATAVDVLGSSPSTVGTSMALTGRGAVIGSVSGGCVEAAAIDGCRELLAGRGPRVGRYGFGDAAAVRAGLACGGELDVLFQMLHGASVEAELAAAVAGRPAALAVVTAGPARLLGRTVAGREGAGLQGDLADHDLAGLPLRLGRVRAVVGGRLAMGRSGPADLACGSELLRLFVDVAVEAPLFVIVGATELAAALAAAAVAVGYRVEVVDPRAAFARPERVPAASRVVLAAPHAFLAEAPLDARTVVCLLTHDEDLDPVALAVALERGAGFVGALGSRATTARRAARLRALGVPEHRIAALRSPLGLDLGASSPAETAVSILAEVLAARTGSTGLPLRDREGPVHRPARAAEVVP
jgi:xanthine dehydrogenase accessory factor